MTYQEQCQKLHEVTSAADICNKGLLVAEFDELNTTLADMLQEYVYPSVTTEVERMFQKLPAFKGTGETRINVFTRCYYKRFLQLICMEDFRENRDSQRTIFSEVMFSENGVTVPQLSSMPLIKNTAAGRTVFNKIDKSPYAQFTNDKVWIVREQTQFIQVKGRKVLTEVNIYLPDQYVKFM
ncbi:MAG: hypothetical protein RSC43_01235 [Clostridia bacterium]